MKLSLESFKQKFNEESKEELLNELTGGVLANCHCGTEHIEQNEGAGHHHGQ